MVRVCYHKKEESDQDEKSATASLISPEEQGGADYIRKRRSRRENSQIDVALRGTSAARARPAESSRHQGKN